MSASLIYLEKLSVIIEGERKPFCDKSMLKKFMAAYLQRMLKGILQSEEKGKHT